MPPKFGGGPKCAQCLLSAYPFESVSYSGSVYHAACFSCQLCKQRITSVVSVTELNGAIFHKSCFGRRLQAAGGKFGVAPPPKPKWLAGISLSSGLPHAVVQRVFNDYDKDHDGALDRSEAARFVEEWCRQLSVPFTPSVLEKFFATFDVNKDGRISPAELLGDLLGPAEIASKPTQSLHSPSGLEIKSVETKTEAATVSPALQNVTPGPTISIEEKQIEDKEPPPLSALADQQPGPYNVVSTAKNALSKESVEEAISHYASYSNYGNEDVNAAGNYDEIAQVVSEEKTRPATAQNRAPIVSDTTYQWQERFEAILDMSSQTPKAKLEKAKALQALNNEFCDQARLLAKELVRDSFLPKSERAHKALSGMGVAGGEKYLARGMFIKMPKDLGLGIYGGDMGAIKAAKHEINSLQALLDCDVPRLFFPLMCCVTYQGFRLVCSSLIAGLGKHTLAYGSQDAGNTIHCSDPDLNHKVEQACLQLGLAPHNSVSNDKKCQVLYGPADLEGHVLMTPQKKKLYLLDFARLMPPESPHKRGGMSVNAVVYRQDGTTSSHITDNINAFVTSTVTGAGVLKRVPLSEGILFFREPSQEAKNVLASELANREIKSASVLVTETGRIFYELLRPEIVKSYGKPLSSDAFSGFGSCKLCFGVTHFCPHGGQGHNTRVAGATDCVVSTLSRFAVSLENRLINLADCPTLVRELHRVGINLRWLGSLLEQVQTPYIKRLIFMEMVCRTLRQVLAAKQRRIVESAARQGVKLEVLEENLKLAGLEMFNLALGSSDSAHSFWQRDLVELLKNKYFRTRRDEVSGLYMGSSSTLGREFLLKFPLFSRLQQIACFKFTQDVNQRLFQNPNDFEQAAPFVLGDVVGCEVQVQRLQFDESINVILHELAHFKDKDDELRPSLIRAMSFKTEVASARMVYHQMALDTFGQEHPYVIDSFFKLSLDLRRTHSIDLALKMATQGLKCCMKTYGSFSHQYVMGLTTVGEIEMEAMLYPAAIATFGQALERANRIHGGKEGFHPLVAKLCAYLGRLNMLHGDKQAGALYLGRSYSVYEKLYGRKVSDYLTPVVTMGKGEQVGTALAEMAFSIRSVCDENGMIEEGEVQNGVLMLAGDLARGLPPGPALSGATIIERIRSVVTIIEDIDGVPRGYFMVDSDEGCPESSPRQAEAKARAAPPPLQGPCGVCSELLPTAAAGDLFIFWVRSLSTVTCTVSLGVKSQEVVPTKEHLYDVVSDQVVPPSVYTTNAEGSAYNYTASGEDSNPYTILEEESKKSKKEESKEEASVYNYVSSEGAYAVLEEEKSKTAASGQKEGESGGTKEQSKDKPVGPSDSKKVEKCDLPGVALEVRPFIGRSNQDAGLCLYSVAYCLTRVGRFTITVRFSDDKGPQSLSFDLLVEPGPPCHARTQLRIGQTAEGFEFVVRVRDAFGNCLTSTGKAWGEQVANRWHSYHKFSARVDARIVLNDGQPLSIPQTATTHPNNADFLVSLPLSTLRNNCNYSFVCTVDNEPIRGCPVAFKSPDSAFRYCNTPLSVFGGPNECFVPVCTRCASRDAFQSKCVFCQRNGANTILRYCTACSLKKINCYLCGERMTNAVNAGYAKACDLCTVASKYCLALNN